VLGGITDEIAKKDQDYIKMKYMQIERNRQTLVEKLIKLRRKLIIKEFTGKLI
jgi:hypothetical protein